MKRRTIIFIILLVLVAAGGYFLYSQLIGGEEESTIGAARTIESAFDTNFFSETKFGGLKQQITLPVEAGQKGKIDPFMKF